MTTIDTAEIERPSKLLAFTEPLRAIFEYATLPWAAAPLLSAPHGDGHPVLILPGFMTSDMSTSVLRKYLKQLGYEPHTWDLGRNLGPRTCGWEGEKLIARFDAVYAATGNRVSLIGWSLGGVLARQLARRRPEMVRQIITLGSPFTGNPAATNVMAAYEYMTGQRLRDAHTAKQLAESREVPPVPSTAIFTKGDGIVAWQNCMEPESPLTDNIEVRGSHCGLGINASVLYAIADRLAQKDGEWKPFDRKGMRAFVYPSSGHAH
ncbi:Alpha/beta hydrolase [Sphingomonas antarctica]|uniref:esterase/lipase family protein n=1 Tax=Sphingomonas antarctica TaxID=2040274 RepID=UPI0039E90466